MSPKAILKLIETSLSKDKAIDVAVIFMAGKSTIADYMVIASGSSQRQIGAMADHLLIKLKKIQSLNTTVEGRSGSDWVLIDAGDVIIHLFKPETRAFYNLEKMWGPAILDGTDSDSLISSQEL